ncbi:MAG: sigma factor-like helix-turn-helix DNA-binding protein, partial [Gemmatimonadota bacterium]
RQVLVLHDVEGLTHEEIGDRLGIATGTSKSQLHKARARMRVLLSPGVRAKKVTDEAENHV